MHDDPVPGRISAGDRARLVDVLVEARARGFLGPGDVEAQLRRSLALVPVLEGAWGGQPVDPPAAVDPAGAPPERPVGNGAAGRPAGDGTEPARVPDTNDRGSPEDLPAHSATSTLHATPRDPLAGRPGASPDGGDARQPGPDRPVPPGSQAATTPPAVVPSRAASPSGRAPGEGTKAVDLGSGGGLPGLVLAVALPSWRWTLLEGSARRASWLAEAIGVLALAPRVTVTAARAEDAGRSAMRASQDLVVARGFASPAVTAECAAPLLRLHGVLLVTEPPGGAPGRWDAGAMAALGLVTERTVVDPVAVHVARLIDPCPERYPRRVGIPAKRPLWT